MNSGSTTAAKDKIASHLLEAGLVDEASLAKARELQKKEGGSLGQALVKIGLIDETTFAEFIGKAADL